MIYLIGQLAVWLLLTAISAGVAGWLFAAQRDAPKRQALRRDRDKLIRDLSHLAAGEEDLGRIEEERARAEAGQTLARIRDSRIAELEQALDQARSRNSEAAAELAELHRQFERGAEQDAEIARLRGAELELEDLRAAQADAAARAEDAQQHDATLQAWRLRYFERRVEYLETQARMAAQAPLPEPEAEPEPVSPLPDWRVREAEARARYLTQELRALTAPAAEEESGAEDAPFASSADVDMLLRWRLLYLERRVAHLQAQAAELDAEPAAPQPLAAAPAIDPDLWRWRARYLEARLRHLEQRAAETRAAPEAVASDEPEHAASPPPVRRVKPPVLGAARNGAPDDLTLIDGVSPMRQSTLYALGVFHYDQIAAWTPENVAWIDNYLRLRGRIEEEEWLQQAADLAREGPSAARRMLEDESV